MMWENTDGGNRSPLGKSSVMRNGQQRRRLSCGLRTLKSVEWDNERMGTDEITISKNKHAIIPKEHPWT